MVKKSIRKPASRRSAYLPAVIDEYAPFRQSNPHNERLRFIGCARSKLSVKVPYFRDEFWPVTVWAINARRVAML
jgi:hypothetical protein